MALLTFHDPYDPSIPFENYYEIFSERKRFDLFKSSDESREIIQQAKKAIDTLPQKNYSTDEKLKLFHQIQIVNENILYCNEIIDKENNTFWITVVHIILLVLTLGIFSYKASMKLEEISLSLETFFGENATDLLLNYLTVGYLIRSENYLDKLHEKLANSIGCKENIKLLEKCHVLSKLGNKKLSEVHDSIPIEKAIDRPEEISSDQYIDRTDPAHPFSRFLGADDPMGIACANLNPRSIEDTLQSYPFLLNSPSGSISDPTPLQIVLTKQDCTPSEKIECAKILLEYGADPNKGAANSSEANEGHYHPLRELVLTADPELVQLFFAKGGKLPQSKSIQCTIMDYLAKMTTSSIRNKADFVKFDRIARTLLDEGISIFNDNVTQYIKSLEIRDFLNLRPTRLSQQEIALRAQQTVSPEQQFSLLKLIFNRFIEHKKKTTGRCSFFNYPFYPELLKQFLAMGFDPFFNYDRKNFSFLLEEIFDSYVKGHFPSTINADETLCSYLHIFLDAYKNNESNKWTYSQNPLNAEISLFEDTISDGQPLWERLSDHIKQRLLREGYSPTD